MSMAAVMRAESQLLVPTYERYPILFTRGRGVYLYDSQGKRYLDFLSGIGVNALGYGHPVIARVLSQQSKRLIHVSNLFFHQYQAELAKRLTRMSGLDRAFFCNSGTEAWEGALKFARAFAQSHHRNGHAPKSRIVALENSFHGRTFGSLATTGQAKYREPFAPLVPGVTFVRLNDCEDLKRRFDDSVCAVCMETIQGEGGIRPVSSDFLHLARDLSIQHGALLLLDEIQCGLGRTGKCFAYQHYGIQPDIVTVAKPLAAGLPLGAILTTNEVAASMHPGLHGTTFGGGPLSCAVALEFLQQMEKRMGHIPRMGDYFRKQLESLAKKHGGEVRGMGLMLAWALDSADLAKAVVKNLMHRGILINRTNETALRFLPPYIIEKKHVDVVTRELDRAMAELKPQHSGAKSKIARSTA
ncbi:MAG TPA: aspartate aminotransferase family protein [Terriglobales bacterium]|nr:aspartate aminotransferase family protein [Terriglobales bacterium]